MRFEILRWCTNSIKSVLASNYVLPDMICTICCWCSKADGHPDLDESVKDGHLTFEELESYLAKRGNLPDRGMCLSDALRHLCT